MSVGVMKRYVGTGTTLDRGRISRIDAGVLQRRQGGEGCGPIGMFGTSLLDWCKDFTNTRPKIFAVCIPQAHFLVWSVVSAARALCEYNLSLKRRSVIWSYEGTPSGKIWWKAVRRASYRCRAFTLVVVSLLRRRATASQFRRRRRAC